VLIGAAGGGTTADVLDTGAFETGAAVSARFGGADDSCETFVCPASPDDAA
jgi:hypothetical protein